VVAFVLQQLWSKLLSRETFSKAEVLHGHRQVHAFRFKVSYDLDNYIALINYKPFLVFAYIDHIPLFLLSPFCDLPVDVP
jgi:hypothetical protein